MGSIASCSSGGRRWRVDFASPVFYIPNPKEGYVSSGRVSKGGGERTGLHCFGDGGFHALKGGVALRVGVEHCFLFYRVRIQSVAR